MSLLAHWEPVEQFRGEMSRLQQEMDRWLGRHGFSLPRWPAPVLAHPPVNVWEDDEFTYVEAELPGVNLEELDILLTGPDELTLKGVRAAPDAPTKVTWHRQERVFEKFSRTIALPTVVDDAKVEATLEQGVLAVKLAKSSTSKPKKISVKTG